ncbi:hypothetical protein [Trinickia dabaoshanensis]|uniref:hypothetical protein n=1 Tax=Trinickia dabaoshanensis TaxID=564714 RepID=UPI0038CD4781
MEWLRANGWRFAEDSQHRPKVARSYFEARLGATQSAPESSHAGTIRPRFEALRGCVQRGRPHMGRRRQTNLDLPPRMHLKGGRYYHVGTSLPRQWTPLGCSERGEAQVGGNGTGAGTKSPRARSDNLKELENPKAIFGAMPMTQPLPSMCANIWTFGGNREGAREPRESVVEPHR